MISEYEEQCNFFTQLRITYPNVWKAAYAHCDGAYYGEDEKSRYRTAAKLKRQGAKKGVPDVFIAVAKGKYHGLYIEMKRIKGGAVSEEQKLMLNLLTDNGYACFVAKGADEAFKAVERYLKL